MNGGLLLHTSRSMKGCNNQVQTSPYFIYWPAVWEVPGPFLTISGCGSVTSYGAKVGAGGFLVQVAVQKQCSGTLQERCQGGFEKGTNVQSALIACAIFCVCSHIITCTKRNVITSSFFFFYYTLPKKC